MTPDQHNQAVKASYPLGAQISIDSRTHSPFPFMSEVTGYDYAPTGRVLLRLKHTGPRHWNQPKDFVFDPEIETVAQQEIKSLLLSELEQQNLAILRTFRLNDNVTVRGGPHGSRLKLGHVTGFVYDDSGKLFLGVEFIGHFAKEEKDIEHALVNPNSHQTLVTKID